MSSFYQEFRYSSGENPSGKNDLELSAKIVHQIRKLGNIRTICELGCGNGYFANQLSGLGYEVTGIDASESGIKYACENYGKNAEFIQAGIDHNLVQKVHGSQFDLVIAKEVIEHLYRPSDLMEGAKQLLKKDGYLCLTTPYHGYFKNLGIAILGRTDKHLNPLRECGHIKFFSVRTLSILFAQAGFSNMEFSFFGRVPLFWKSMICIAQNKSYAP